MKSHCVNGHAKSPENVMYIPGRGHWRCRICHAAGKHRTKTASKRMGLWTHCTRGHPLAGENLGMGLRVRNGQRLPWRYCRACKRISDRVSGRKNPNKYSRWKPKISEDVIRAVISNLQDGLTLARICGPPVRAGKPYVTLGIVREGALLAYRRANPKLGRLIDKLAEKNRQASWAGRTRSMVATPSIIRSSDNIMDEIQAAVPGHLPRDLRDDAIQNIWMAVLERRLKRIRAEYKNNHNAWGPRSLDVPLWIDSNTTLLDTLASGSSGLWD